MVTDERTNKRTDGRTKAVCHWTQVPPTIEIQRSHTSNFRKTLGTHNHLFGGQKLTYNFITSDFPLWTKGQVENIMRPATLDGRIRINTILFAVGIAFVIYHAERILTAIPYILGKEKGRGEMGEGKVGDESGERTGKV